MRKGNLKRKFAAIMAMCMIATSIQSSTIASTNQAVGLIATDSDAETISTPTDAQPEVPMENLKPAETLPVEEENPIATETDAKLIEIDQDKLYEKVLDAIEDGHAVDPEKLPYIYEESGDIFEREDVSWARVKNVDAVLPEDIKLEIYVELLPKEEADTTENEEIAENQERIIYAISNTSENSEQGLQLKIGNQVSDLVTIPSRNALYESYYGDSTTSTGIISGGMEVETTAEESTEETTVEESTEEESIPEETTVEESTEETVPEETTAEESTEETIVEESTEEESIQEETTVEETELKETTVEETEEDGFFAKVMHFFTGEMKTHAEEVNTATESDAGRNYNDGLVVYNGIVEGEALELDFMPAVLTKKTTSTLERVLTIFNNSESANVKNMNSTVFAVGNVSALSNDSMLIVVGEEVRLTASWAMFNEWRVSDSKKLEMIESKGGTARFKAKEAGIVTVVCQHHVLQEDTWTIKIVDEIKHLENQDKYHLEWKRSKIDDVCQVINVANWNWQDVQNIKVTEGPEDRDDPASIVDCGEGQYHYVWDGTLPNGHRLTENDWNTDGNYLLDRDVNYTATWKRKASEGSTIERFQTTINLNKLNARLEDEIHLISIRTILEDYKHDFDGLGSKHDGEIIPINDNIYVFVYPIQLKDIVDRGTPVMGSQSEISYNNKTIDMKDYLAFWTGTSGGMFWEKSGTQPTKVDPQKYPQLATTDGWYCDAVEDNIGTTNNV